MLKLPLRIGVVGVFGTSVGFCAGEGVAVSSTGGVQANREMRMKTRIILRNLLELITGFS
jgi:hypothetical protein